MNRKNIKYKKANIKNKLNENSTNEKDLNETIIFKKRMFKYVLRLVRLLAQLPRDVVTREIISQLLRSGCSIGANYFEAQSASSRNDYRRFFTYSLKSANETKFWLAILLTSGLTKKHSPEAQWLLRETKEIANILASSIITLKNKPARV